MILVNDELRADRPWIGSRGTKIDHLGGMCNGARAAKETALPEF